MLAAPRPASVTDRGEYEPWLEIDAAALRRNVAEVSRLVEGRPNGSVAQELDLLRDLGRVMRDASICGLGQTASLAVESGLQLPGVMSA